jgi:hypothetical protein
MWMLNYPFPYATAEVKEAFSVLAASLADALNGEETPDFDARVERYRSEMSRFRQRVGGDDYKYLQFQLWKEGVARYTELKVATLAGLQHTPSKEFTALKDYTPYAVVAAGIHRRILDELPSIALDKSQRVAFYSYGAAEALLLDTVRPRWRAEYLPRKFSLDDYFGKSEPGK